ncbi:MBL fold metallo-hydrolase [Desulfosediminicola flagellatus]|uniref:MBL fold metallo-hydrolase n=1 Tax=Desulfosediminicola flagellatus TaxID=2569541 RepID=UPI0010AB8356|nr:MBL fold metallo-hydrolase [Desulfosediminicola flagellatus]
MSFRISPMWWPVLAVSSPVLIPHLLRKNHQYKRNVQRAQLENAKRIRNAGKIELPELTQFELTVLVEQKAEHGFKHAPGVSYLIKTDQGSLLFDLGYGPEDDTFASNAAKVGFSASDVDAITISHLHPDHMGGFKAVRDNHIAIPLKTEKPPVRQCFLPAKAGTNCLKTTVVEFPQLLSAGIASTGPLARSLFLMGWTEEQAIVARIKGKGLVIFTGCGHPTIETIVDMVRKISDEKIYAIGGGLHFPITDSPLRKPGLKVQMIWGTGKPPWKQINDHDLQTTINNLNCVNPARVFLSAHDTCDYAIDRLEKELNAETIVLKAGAKYHI